MAVEVTVDPEVAKKDTNGDGLLTGSERMMPSNYLTGLPSDAKTISVTDPTKKKKNAE